MEEDLKILETYLENSAYKQKDSDFFKNGGWEIVDLEIPQALENLIKKYRELEEENRIFALAGSNIALKLHIEKNYIPKSKIKEIVDECIPKGKNIITGEEEYQPNTNANSFLTQSILELMEDK